MRNGNDIEDNCLDFDQVDTRRDNDISVVYINEVSKVYFPTILKVIRVKLLASNPGPLSLKKT